MKATTTTRVRLATKPAGATLFRASDGRFLGYAPVIVPLAEGERVRVICRLDGFEDQEVTFSQGGPISRVVALKRAKTVMRLQAGRRPPVMTQMAMPPPASGEWGTVNPFGMRPRPREDPFRPRGPRGRP